MPLSAQLSPAGRLSALAPSMDPHSALQDVRASRTLVAIWSSTPPIIGRLLEPVAFPQLSVTYDDKSKRYTLSTRPNLGGVPSLKCAPAARATSQCCKSVCHSGHARHAHANLVGHAHTGLVTTYTKRAHAPLRQPLHLARSVIEYLGSEDAIALVADSVSGLSLSVSRSVTVRPGSPFVGTATVTYGATVLERAGSPAIELGARFSGQINIDILQTPLVDVSVGVGQAPSAPLAPCSHLCDRGLGS